ncbi:MAG: DNA adenine methylase [Anaerolineales bacterium]
MFEIKQTSDLTYKHNLKNGRHGWLRLTPAYSIKLVNNILDKNPEINRILDPFSGTGTTGLVCGERGIDCDLIDINPFLIWLAEVKTKNYLQAELDEVRAEVENLASRAIGESRENHLWVPPLSNIERWWTKDKLAYLARLHQGINLSFPNRSNAKDLLQMAFCRLVIESSNAAFNHQSMSFKKDELQDFLFAPDDMENLANRFVRDVLEILQSARSSVTGKIRVINGDSRHVPQDRKYNGVITSPPYPNRMSYIRELRPYMYWLEYLKEARQAAELDWLAIGGTWGIATSRLTKWEPNGHRVQHQGFTQIIEGIYENSPLLANYVHKYFIDISLHLESLHKVLEPGAKVFYIVGNSKFYDTLVPVENIYASILENTGFTDTKIETLRKRNSKKELFEFIVSARKAPYDG